MRLFDLTHYSYEVEKCGVRQLKRLEPAIFYAASIGELGRNEALLRAATFTSEKVVLSVPEALASEEGFFAKLESLGRIFALSIRFRISSDAGLAPQIPGRTGSSADSALVSRFVEFVHRAEGRMKVIPEIEIEGDLTHLGPTLVELSRSNPVWCTLAVSGPPNEERVQALQNCFEYLVMRDFPLIDLFFSFNNEHRAAWHIQSKCFFSGPDQVHLDLSNKCTHSCVFCALYAPDVVEALKKKSGGKLGAEAKAFMSAQMPLQRAKEIIESLPIAFSGIQFGGAGDPMTHPNALEIIASARERGFGVEVLSNMEYFDSEDLDRLTELGGMQREDLHFIVNLSGATATTYVKTRPKQTAKTFQKVIGNLAKLTALREKNHGSGAHFTLMCVTNRLNFQDAPEYIRLAAELGASQVWFKPLEIHDPRHYELLPDKETQENYRAALIQARKVSDVMGVALMERSTVDSICDNPGGSRR
ncbi:MAG: radical SAM protein [Bdellovibrionota bacterium]